MPISNYPFRTSEKILLLSPILPIRIVNPLNGLDYLTWGLIDTGAADSAIPEHIAKTLRHDIQSVRPIPGFGASGNFNVYPHTFKIDVFKMNSKGIVDTNQVVHTISQCCIGVICDLPFVLLGVKEFLSKFVLLVDYKNQKVSVKHPKNIIRTKTSLMINF
jgi:hypothetical protein